MKRRSNRSCTYVVALDSAAGTGGVRSLANYLSTLALADCDVLIIDAAAPSEFEEHRRIVRWVGRHVAPQTHHLLADGAVDVISAAAELSLCEKVIVAADDSRYTIAEITALCELLDRHEVVEPEEYVDPLPWWGAIDAGRLLLHRGVDQAPRSRSTFAFRRSVFRPLRGLDDRWAGNHSRRLVLHGAEVHEAHGVFVRREPPPLGRWLRLRSAAAANDLSAPTKGIFFFALMPLIVLLAVIGGARMALAYASAIACVAIMLAVRGRVGAAKFFPLRACLFAPLWVMERSLSLYWALFEKLRAASQPAVPAPASGERVARSAG